MNRKSKIFETAGTGLTVVTVWAVLIMLSDVSPLEVCAMLFRGMLGNLNGFAEVFVKATLLILVDLGRAVVFRIGFFNIGTEGQFYIGALASAWTTLTWAGIPGAPRILYAILMGFAFDGLWALITAMFGTKLRISGAIVTITLSYVVINLLGIAIRTLLMDLAGSMPQSPKLDPSVTFYWFLEPTRFHTGLITAVLMMLLAQFILEKTMVGYEIKVAGFSKRITACNGVSVIRNIIISTFSSGDLTGIAGAVEVVGTQRKLLEGISGECGYTTVLIALLIFNHPLGVLFTAIAFVVLEVGANSIQRQMGVPSAIANILVGLTVLLILGRELFYRKKKEEKPCQSKS